MDEGTKQLSSVTVTVVAVIAIIAIAIAMVADDSALNTAFSGQIDAITAAASEAVAG